MSEGMTRNEILGRMRDEGYATVLVNRVEALLDASGGDIAEFAKLTRGQLMGLYNRGNPNSTEKGLGGGTFKAFDRFVRIWKDSLNDVRQIARETVKAQEAREAEKAAMRQEILDREVIFDVLTSAMAALGTLKLDRCSLGRLLDMYDLASGNAK
jgi:uncharacterized membrane protein